MCRLCSVAFKPHRNYHRLGQLIKIIREPQMVMVVDKLIDFSSSKDEELRDIAGLGTFLLINITVVLIQCIVTKL